VKHILAERQEASLRPRHEDKPVCNPATHHTTRQVSDAKQRAASPPSTSTRPHTGLRINPPIQHLPHEMKSTISGLRALLLNRCLMYMVPFYINISKSSSGYLHHYTSVSIYIFKYPISEIYNSGVRITTD